MTEFIPQIEPRALMQRASELSRKGQHDAAFIFATQAVVLSGAKDQHIINDHALVLWAMGRRDDAIALLDNTALLVRSSIAYHNLALIYDEMSDFKLAEAAYAKAISLQPDNLQLRWDRTLTRLASGHWDDETWHDYDLRLALNPNHYPSQPPMPRWTGEDLTDKILWVYAEQGVGDTIQFSRFLLDIIHDYIGVKIIFDVQQELVALFQPSLLKDIELRVRTSVWQYPKADYHVALLSIPGIVNLNWPQQVPSSWSFMPTMLGRMLELPVKKPETIRVGICWAGAAHHLHDKYRSMPFEKMLRLVDQRYQLYSFQVGPRAHDVQNCGARPLVYDLGVQLTDWVMTAAALQQMDVVVSVDTAVAHLAASLHKPTMLLLHQGSDWRWLRGKNTTYLYPTLHIFYQVVKGDWEPCINGVKDYLDNRYAPAS